MQPKKSSNIKKTILYSGLAVLVVGLVVCVVIYAVLPPGSKTLNITAALSEVVGVVQVRPGQQAPFNPVNDGFLLRQKQLLQTKPDSKVRLDLSTGSIIRLGQSTIFSLDSQDPVNNLGGLSQIQLQAGRVWIILKGGTINVNTPAGLASVRGSYMSIWMDPTNNQIVVCCLEGSCGFTDKAGDVDMTSGQKIVSSNTNIVPPLQKMDQTDIQSWQDNSPESAPIILQVAGLIVSSTPTLTSSPTDTETPTLTMTASPSASTTLSASPAFSASPTLTPSLTASLAPLFTLTPSLAPLYTKTDTSQPTHTRTARPTRTSTITTYPTEGSVQSAPAASATSSPAPSATLKPSKTPAEDEPADTATESQTIQ